MKTANTARCDPAPGGGAAPMGPEPEPRAGLHWRVQYYGSTTAARVTVRLP